MVHFIPARMEQFIPARMKLVIPSQPEWNGPFRSGRNEMAHSILAGMDLFTPAGIEWSGLDYFIPVKKNGHSLDANKKYASI